MIRLDDPTLVCSDGFSCSADLCGALPSVAASVAGDLTPDSNGCIFDTVNGPGCPPAENLRDCAANRCIAEGHLPPGDGCVLTERTEGGLPFCACALTSCHTWRVRPGKVCCSCALVRGMHMLLPALAIVCRIQLGLEHAFSRRQNVHHLPGPKFALIRHACACAVARCSSSVAQHDEQS